MTEQKIKPLFDFGQVVATSLLANDMDKDQALKNNCGRLLSRYHTSKQDIYIMTQQEPISQTETALYTTLMYCNEY